MYDCLLPEPVDAIPILLPFNLSIIYPLSIPFSIKTFFCEGLPSSSIFIEPHSLGIVPSSIAVTKLEAIFWPILLQYIEVPLATEVASRPCPHASWKITPPNPLSIITGNLPLGQYFAFTIVFAIRDASLPIASRSNPSINSNPFIAPGLIEPDCISPSLEATELTMILFLTLLSSFQRPSEFAIIICWSWSKCLTVTWDITLS